MIAAVFCLYATIALVTLRLTFIEQRTNGIDAAGPCLLGCLACLLWPVALPALAAVLRIQSRGERRPGGGRLASKTPRGVER